MPELDRILTGWLGFLYVTPLKRAWLILGLISIALHLIAIWRVPLWGFRVYLAMAGAAAVLQNTGHWSLGWEIGLAGALGLATFEVVFFSPFGVPHAWARHYDRQVAMVCGMTVLALMVLRPPVPYPGYPVAWDYARLYSTAVCLACIVGSVLQAWDMRQRVDRFLRGHGLLFIPWLGMTLILGQSHERGTAPNYTPYFTRAIVGEAGQLMFLLGWLIVSSLYGPRRTDNRLAASAQPAYPRGAASSS